MSNLLDNQQSMGHSWLVKQKESFDMVCIETEPSEEQVETAAKAWMAWQFPNRDWDEAVPAMQDMFKTGARKALTAVAAMDSRGNTRDCA